MKRPVIFALEVVVGLFIAIIGGWLASMTGKKMNGKANADIRSSYALERIAEAQERAHPEHPALPRPSLLAKNSCDELLAACVERGHKIAEEYDFNLDLDAATREVDRKFHSRFLR